MVLRLLVCLFLVFLFIIVGWIDVRNWFLWDYCFDCFLSLCWCIWIKWWWVGYVVVVSFDVDEDYGSLWVWKCRGEFCVLCLWLRIFGVLFVEVIYLWFFGFLFMIGDCKDLLSYIGCFVICWLVGFGFW